MKKIILSAIAMVLLALPMYAQKIIVDKTDDNGDRHIATDSELIRAGLKDKNPFSFSLNYFSNTNNKIDTYGIFIEMVQMSNFQIPQGGVLLLKLSNGEIIESRQTLRDVDTEDIIGTYNQYTKMRTHTIKCHYNMKEDELNKIAMYGLSKIRLETKTGFLESEYKTKQTDKSKTIFDERIKLIKSALTKHSDIRSGF